MTEAPDLLNTLFGIGQIFSVLLLLFGVYLSTLEAVLTVKCSRKNEQQPEFSNCKRHGPQKLEMSGNISV